MAPADPGKTAESNQDGTRHLKGILPIKRARLRPAGVALMNYVKTKLKLEMMDHGDRLEIVWTAAIRFITSQWSLQNDSHNVLKQRPIDPTAFSGGSGESGTVKRRWLFPQYPSGSEELIAVK